jgi:hypothetical protein
MSYAQMTNKTKEILTLKPKPPADTANTLLDLKNKIFKENKKLLITKLSENNTKNTIDIHCDDSNTMAEIMNEIQEKIDGVEIIEQQTVHNHKCIKLYNSGSQTFFATEPQTNYRGIRGTPTEKRGLGGGAPRKSPPQAKFF